jgi:hypothetical protein
MNRQPYDGSISRVAVALHNRLPCIPNGLLFTSGYVVYGKGLAVGMLAGSDTDPNILRISRDVSDPALTTRLEVFAQCLRGLGWKVLSADTLKDYPQ